jgi:acyl-CoA reductase-like NAD-dependent aldehyde dehydrogenase
MLNVDAALKDLLPKSLDPDTFCIMNATLYSQEHVFLVDQTAKSNASSANQLSSNSSARAIAIVDRNADIESAAKTIVKARFSFQGTSPYSPDLIIVNDYIKGEFTEACSRYAGKFFPFASKPIGARNNNFIETKKALKDAEEKGKVTTSGTAVFKVVDIHDR